MNHRNKSLSQSKSKQICLLEQKLAQLNNFIVQGADHYNHERFESALSCFLEAYQRLTRIEKKQRISIPDYTLVMVNIMIQIGRSYNELNNLDEAIKWFTSAIVAAPTRIDVHSNLANAYYGQNKDDLAKSHAEKALEINEEEYLALQQENTHLGDYLAYTRNLFQIIYKIALIAGTIEEVIKKYDGRLDNFSLCEIAVSQNNYQKQMEYAIAARKPENKLSQEQKILTYFYQGIAVANMYQNRCLGELNEADQVAVKVGIHLLEKGLEVASNSEALQVLARLKDDGKLCARDPKAALALYQKAAGLGNINSTYDLGWKYYYGQDVEIDLPKAFAYIHTAAQQGQVKAAGMLGVLYLKSEGCVGDLEQAIFWLRKACADSSEGKFYKNHLAIVLLFQASHQEQQNEEQLKKIADEVFTLLTEAGEAGFEFAYYNLAIVYEYGMLGESNHALAEHYYRLAISQGSKDASDNLLLMYVDRLINGQISDANYSSTVSSVRELLVQEYAVSAEEALSIDDFIELILKRKIIKHEIAVLINKVINLVYYDKNSKPSEKINFILDVFNADCFTSTINMATSFLRVSDLLDRCHNAREIFATEVMPLFPLFIERYVKLLARGAFSTRSLCNIITGLSRFYTYGYDPGCDQMLVMSFKWIASNIDKLSLLDLQSVMAGAIKIDLSKNLITTCLQQIIDAVINNLQSYIENKEDLSNVLYDFSVLDNYKKYVDEFHIIIPIDSLKPMVDYALAALGHVSLSNKVRHQYFSGLLYFCDHYPDLIEKDLVSRLMNHAKDFQHHQQYVVISMLQRKIFNYIASYFPHCQQEYLINTLPVDIYLEMPDAQAYIIQVNGPTHYIVIDYEQHHARSPKDLFHDALLNANLFKQDAASDKKAYKIINLDYLQYAAEREQYVKKELEKNGIIFPEFNIASQVTLFQPQRPSSQRQRVHSGQRRNNGKGKEKELPKQKVWQKK